MTPRARTFGLALALLLLACGRRPPLRLPLPQGTGIAVDGHQDLSLVGGTAIPVFASSAADTRGAGICLRLAPEVDASAWRGRVAIGRSGLAGAAFSPPRARAASTLCFATKVAVRAPADAEICLEVEDGYDRQRYVPVCRPARFLAADSGWAALRGALGQALAQTEPAWRIAALDSLARRAERAGLAGLAVSCALIVSDLRRNERSPAALDDAERRLAKLPAFLAQPAASSLAGQAAYQRALLALERGRLAAAWHELGAADERFLAVASPLRLAVAMRRGEIRGRLGAAEEGAAELRRELAACPAARCDERLVPSVEAELAWLVLLDPEPAPEALDDAERRLRRALPELDPLERANHRIDLALLEVRRGRDPAQPLAAARAELRGGVEGWPAMLAAWADLVEGLGALGAPDVLSQDEAGRAAALCGRPGLAAEPALAAWAASCVAAAERRRGDLAAAAASGERALLLHELAAGEPFDRRFPLGSSQRADDFYSAARTAVEAGRPERAWAILDRLDALAAEEGGAPPAGTLEQQERRERRESLAARLAALEAPASAARRSALRPALDRLREEIQELARTTHPAAPGAPPAPNAADLRAIALPDEILLLARTPEGEVRAVRQTPFARRALRRLLAEIDAPRAGLSDHALRGSLVPLSRALAPPPDLALHGPVVYALYGALQRVPLAALPLGDVDGGAWLADRLTPALVPARVETSTASSIAPGGAARALFIVDPQGNLGSARELSAEYRSRFPGARILAGPAATRNALAAALPTADWLHLDVHGRFDADFPELSSLELADGPLSLAQLGELPAPRELANLSGCSTAAWPVTAAGGRYGFAGQLASRGTAWVVAARAALPDRLARDFNRVFYAELAAGGNPARSFARAHAAVRRSWPAAEWSKLVLLAGRGRGGQSQGVRTPGSEERIRGTAPASGKKRVRDLTSGGVP